jgi:ribosomal protein RSM22 (predicted rRNA methylase)
MRPGKTRIHRGLVGDRTLVGSRYLSQPDLRREYDSEIAPRTEAALRRILGQVQLELQRPRRVLDLGAGTGAAARVLRGCLGEDVEMVAVDRVAGPGILVADVLRGVRPAGVSGRFDLIVAAHLLNELGRSLDLDGRARLVAGWCRDLLEPDGTCIVIEPALRDTSRALLGVRDRLLAAGLHVAAPCLCQLDCPALLRDRDWCHDSAEVLVAGRSRVDFSYLILRQSRTKEVDRNRYRVVSDPLKDKGRLRFFVCGATGRLVLMRLDRDRSAANQALDRACRGDIIVLPNAPVRDDGIRIVGETVVEVDPPREGSF